jgi:DNA repair protein RecO (recombination protein O)
MVLRVVPYGEADAVVHLCARGLGNVGAFARGARKSHKRFAGGLEPFGLLAVELQPRRGRDLAELRGSRPVESFPSVRGDLAKMAHAGYATELVRELGRDHEANDALFEALLAFLRRLDASEARSLRLRAYELAALSAAGLAPVLDRCARCASDQATWFDADVGGLACERCRGPRAVELGGSGARLLRALQAGGVEAGDADEAHLPLEPCRRALRAFVGRHVRHELGSLAFLRDVGAPS